MSVDRFGEALAAWEALSDSGPMVALLSESLTPLGIDVSASHQKGCDCTAIEIDEKYVCPYDDDASAEAIVYCFQLLKEQEGDFIIGSSGYGYGVYERGDFTTFVFKKPNLIVAVLEALTLLKQS